MDKNKGKKMQLSKALLYQQEKQPHFGGNRKAGKGECRPLKDYNHEDEEHTSFMPSVSLLICWQQEGVVSSGI